MALSNGLNKRTAFGLIELLVSLLISGILMVFIYQTFIRQKDALERGGKDAELQKRGRLIMQNLKQTLQRGGEDPCRLAYWDDSNTEQSNYAYAAVHPWSAGAIFNGAIVVPNPYQAAIIHYDVSTGGQPGTLSCAVTDDSYQRAVPIAGTSSPVLKHNRPYHAWLLYVQGDPDDPADPSDPFTPSFLPGGIWCPGFAPGSLLLSKVVYDNPMTRSPQVICQDTLNPANNTRVLATGVECLHLDYILPTDSFGQCGVTSFLCPPTASDYPACNISRGSSCRLNDSTYMLDNQLRAVNKVKVTLVVRGQHDERGYSHPPVTTNSPENLCLNDPIFPTGHNLTGVAYRTLTFEEMIPLPATEYR